MGLRFRRLRILPGLWLNLSKSGVSTSIGGRGATLNLGKRGTRTTVGLPGTGVSYRTSIGGGHRRRGYRLGSMLLGAGAFFFLAYVAIYVLISAL